MQLPLQSQIATRSAPDLVVQVDPNLISNVKSFHKADLAATERITTPFTLIV